MMIQYGLQMTQNLTNFLATQESKKYATQNGTNIHQLLRKVVFDKDKIIGDKNIITQIQKHPELKPFFSASAQTEVAIAGILNSVFISRRIDRLLINNETKTIDFIDYKTNINKTEFIDKYKKQLSEYAQLLQSAYPEYKITGYILWIHDWQLAKMVAL